MAAKKKLSLDGFGFAFQLNDLVIHRTTLGDRGQVALHHCVVGRALLETGTGIAKAYTLRAVNPVTGWIGPNEGTCIPEEELRSVSEAGSKTDGGTPERLLPGISEDHASALPADSLDCDGTPPEQPVSSTDPAP